MTADPSSAGPPSGPPPSPVPMGSASSPFPAPERTRGRKGLPFLLALAVVLASFPAILTAGLGALAVLAGNDISNSSYDSFDYSTGSSYDGSSSDTFDVDQFGDNTVQVGLAMLAVGSTMLVCSLLAGMGSEVGRVMTALWLVVAAVYLVSRAVRLPDGAALYAAVFIAPPVVALIGLFAPASNAVFRGDHRLS